MSKKNKDNKKKEEPKKPEAKTPWWGPFAGIAIILILLSNLLHPNGAPSPSTSSSPRPPDGLIRIDRWDWVSARPGQPKELLPIITENGQQYAVPRSRLRGRLNPESQWLATPRAPDTQYTVLTSSY